VTLAQRRIVTRTLFSLAGLCGLMLACLALVLVNVANDPGPPLTPERVGAVIAVTLPAAGPPLLLGLALCILGLYVRAGGPPD